MIFIWDGKDILLNYLLQVCPVDSHLYVFDIRALDALDTADFEAHEGIVILAELGWNGPSTEYLGFRIMWRLRSNNILLPINLVSRSREIFFKDNLEYSLIKDPSLSFVDYYKVIDHDFTFEPPLNEDVNTRLISSYAGTDALIRNVLHGVKGKLIFDSDILHDDDDAAFVTLIENNTSKCFQKIGRLLNRSDEVLQIQDEFLTSIKNELQTLEAKKEKIDFKKRIPDFFKSYSSKIDEVVSRRTGALELEQKALPFRGVFLDDEQRIRKRTVQEFNSRYYFQRIDHETGEELREDFLLTASTPDELFEILEADSSNFINMVIVDYILEDAEGKLMRMQGSTVLKELYNHRDKFYLFVALSSVGKTISEIQREYTFKVLPFHKELVFASDVAFSDFADRVTTEAEKIHQAFLRKPQTKSWQEGVSYKNKVEASEIEAKIKALTDFLNKTISVTKTKKQARAIAEQLIMDLYALQRGDERKVNKVLESEPLWKAYRLYRSAIDYTEMEDRLNKDAIAFVEELIEDRLSFDVPIPYSENIIPTYSNDVKVKKMLDKLFCRRIIILLWYHLSTAKMGRISTDDSKKYKQILYAAITTGSMASRGNMNVVNSMNFNLGLSITKKLNKKCLLYEEIQLIQQQGYTIH